MFPSLPCFNSSADTLSRSAALIVVLEAVDGVWDFCPVISSVLLCLVLVAKKSRGDN